MAFAARFYSFTINLNHVDRNVFTRFRIKTALHPHEPLEHLYGRMLAYAHCFRDGQSFSQGLFEPKEPTIWSKDFVGEVQLWVQLGVPEKKKLEHALRAAASDVELRVYFWRSEQVHEFCHMLRGSKTNWVAPVTFYQIDDKLLDSLAQHDHSSPEWGITFVDGRMYLVADNDEFESEISTVDIWAAYQESLLVNEQL